MNRPGLKISMEDIEKQIRVGRRKLQLLKRERQQIAKEIESLREIRQKLIVSVIQANNIYEALTEQIEAIAELIPFTEEEQDAMNEEYNRAQERHGWETQKLDLENRIWRSLPFPNFTVFE